MVRVLIMGRGASTWAGRVREVAGPALELDTARLPAEGIRRFEATPPDALVVVDADGGARARTLIQAIQNRPLGRLLPIVLVSAAPNSLATPVEIAAELGVDDWLPPEASAVELVHALSGALDLPEDELTHEPLPGDAPQVEEHDGFVIEQLPDEDEQPEPAPQPPPEDEPEPEPVYYQPPPGPVERVDHQSLFPVRPQQVRHGEVSEEVLRRKLREVRHEDYYTILEVRRGAEGAVIKQAFQRLMARYDPGRLEFDLVHRHFDEIAEIRDAVEDAWAVLGDPELRRRYLEASAGR